MSVPYRSSLFGTATPFRASLTVTLVIPILLHARERHPHCRNPRGSVSECAYVPCDAYTV